MPRPKKCRRICRMPQIAAFIPETASVSEPVILQLDEYEAIRLIDLEGLTQEECAVQMGTARTTITGIYNSARKKVANALVNGKKLLIQGGNYRLCMCATDVCNCRHCKKENLKYQVKEK